MDASREEIRLLTLHPSLEGDNRLRCTLRPVALLSESGRALEPPPYEALSYVWGKPDFSSPISVNDQELYITPTLTTILTSLRRDTDRTLWVDAICINQANLAERAHQVTIMRKVYSLCRRVIGWIGPTLGTVRKRYEHNTDLPENWLAADKVQVSRAMEVMNEILAQDPQTLNSFKQEFLKRYGDIEHIYDNGYTKMLPPPERKDLRCLLQSVPYWTRVWVVQELSFAPRVTLKCETAEVEWERISKLLTKEPYFDAFHTLDDGTDGRAYDPEEEILSMFTQVKIIEDQRRAMLDPAAESFQNLLDVLARFRDKEAADPRDRIYGLLGLADGGHNINVDYEKPLRAIFQDVTVSVINASHNLDILCQNPFERRNGPQVLKESDNLKDSSQNQIPRLMPSWVADFGPSRRKNPSILFAQRDIFNAGPKGIGEPIKVVGKNKNILTLKGGFVGQIGPMEDDWVGLNWENMFQDGWHGSSRGTILRDKEGEYSAWRVLQDLGERQSESATRLGGSPSPAIQDEAELPNDVESSIQAFWRTMTKDCTAPPSMRRLTKDEITELHKINTRRIKAGGPLTTSYARGVSNEILYRFYNETPYHSHQVTWEPEPEWKEGETKLWLRKFPYQIGDYKFATTLDGLYMLTRHQAQEGDIVAVLDGGKVPVVLRRVDPSGNDDFEELYHFVCIAYVHGIMDGEVEKAVERGWVEKREIMLA
jgi:hypothetical protein